MTAGTATRDPGGVRVLLVDDHQPYRAAARALLDAAGLDVVDEAADGATALREAGGGAIDVVVVDLHLPDISGIEVIHQLHDSANPPIIVAMSMDDDPALVGAALAAGAVRFVAKGSPPSSLIDAIVGVAR